MSDIEFSRPVSAARELGDAALADGEFLNKRVLLTGAVPFVASQNGKWMAEDCLRLMVRTWRHVTIFLPVEAEELESRLKEVAKEIEFASKVSFLKTTPKYETFDAILSVGGQAREDLPWTVINSDGWRARVSSTGKPIATGGHSPNPIGAMAAASLGVADLFKRTALKKGHFDVFDALTFSAFDYDVGGEDPGPDLPESLLIPATLFLGQGAIGNANVLLASQLPLRGRLLLFDKDVYGPENLGTCVLLGRDAADDRVAKADWNADRLRAVSAEGTVDSLRGDIQRDAAAVEPYLSLVINGLDRVEPRHAIQDLWPDTIVDGALRRFQCQSATYVYGEGYACLRCLFDVPPARDPLAAQADLVGLPIDVIARDLEITDAHVAAAPEAKKEFLKSVIGSRAHSVACARAIEMKEMFAEEVDENFAPSVPFVATMTAVLVMGQATLRLMGMAPVARRVQFDILVGPHRAVKINERARPGCRCQKRTAPIEALRTARAARQQGSVAPNLDAEAAEVDRQT